MHTKEQGTHNEEAQALAACYRLLLKKAAERRTRLAEATKDEEPLAEKVATNEKATA